MKTSVIVPAFNEEKTVGIILEKLISLDYIDEIVIVNDCSSDGTKEAIDKISNPKLHVIHHEKNQGKTAAVNTALKQISGDVCVIQDADMEYDPDELFDVLNPILLGQADVVYGSRFLVKKTCRVLYFYHYLANKGLTFASNLLTNLNMSDIETCYKAFKVPILQNINLTSKGFGMEIEITAIIGHLKCRIYEVPISYYGRTYEDGKKIGIKDGLYAVWYIFYYNLYYVRTAHAKKHINSVKQRLSKES